jgi:alkylation response protein AidB-like acyl-CoA dehydrogenase
MKGFYPSKKENKLGLRASETASVVFEDCYVPDANRLGDEGQGFIKAPGLGCFLSGRHSCLSLVTGEDAFAA